jgi:hypothetical protein
MRVTLIAKAILDIPTEQELLDLQTIESLYVIRKLVALQESDTMGFITVNDELNDSGQAFSPKHDIWFDADEWIGNGATGYKYVKADIDMVFTDDFVKLESLADIKYGDRFMTETLIHNTKGLSVLMECMGKDDRYVLYKPEGASGSHNGVKWEKVYKRKQK